MGKRVKDKEKKYWIMTYIPVFNHPETPEDEDAYYSTKEEAESEMKQMEFLQPENLYFIVEKEEDGSEEKG